MILMKDTYATYLVLPGACSCIAGYYYFTNRMLGYSKVIPTTNEPILTEYKTLKSCFPSQLKQKQVVLSKMR